MRRVRRPGWVTMTEEEAADTQHTPRYGPPTAGSGFLTPDAMRTANEDTDATPRCENRRPGSCDLPEQNLATMYTNARTPDKRCVEQPPASLLGSGDRERPARTARLAGFTPIARRRRGVVGSESSVSDPITRERACIRWFQSLRIGDRGVTPSRLSTGRLAGSRGDLA